MAERHVNSIGAMVPADAAPPVYQPWVAVQAAALSRLKTEIQRSLDEFQRRAAEAGRLLDTARATAAAQSTVLEAAAWVAFHRYMDEAKSINENVMGPALAAYADAMAEAHHRLRIQLEPVEHAYTQTAADATYTKTLATPGAATV